MAALVARPIIESVSVEARAPKAESRQKQAIRVSLRFAVAGTESIFCFAAVRKTAKGHRRKKGNEECPMLKS
ncbi:MAG: hypothetical protein ACLGHF_00740 [Alphaproteobacteria bacterium]